MVFQAAESDCTSLRAEGWAGCSPAQTNTNRHIKISAATWFSNTVIEKTRERKKDKNCFMKHSDFCIFLPFAEEQHSSFETRQLILYSIIVKLTDALIFRV